jgi:short-subunit dehydrogenase
MEQQSGSPLAVVTGASSGIGYALAEEFARHGFDLLIAAEDVGITVAGDRLRSLGPRVDSVQVDLATYDGVEQLVHQMRADGRAVDAIAINAGVGVGGAFAEQDLGEVLNLIALNVTSSVHLAKRALEDMVPRGAGRMLITSSIAAEMPGSFAAAYNASKAFLLSFAEAIRNELKDTGITVTALQPGATATDFFRRSHQEDTKVGAGKKDDPADVARDAYEALMSGKDHIVAGSWKNKVEATIAQILPESTKAQIHRGSAQPGSARPK